VRSWGRFSEKKAPSLKRPRFYVGHVALALEHLHGQRVLFRGVKPENVGISGDGYPKLLDFGLSKQLASSSSKTSTLCGDPEFVAPEVLLKRAYGVAVDCWALGVLAFEL
jgi:serine/threonine protein kinase